MTTELPVRLDASTEQWRDIPDMIGFYQASSLGRIRSVSRTRRIFGGWTAQCKGRIISLLKFPSGYLRFNASLDGAIKSVAVHRCVALAFINNAENKPCVNHKDSNRANNSASNLEWVTNQENCLHASAAGRLPKGDRHHSKTKPWVIKRGTELKQAKLTEASVSEMRHRHHQGETISALAMERGVSEQSAGRAIYRKTWRHVA